MEPLGTARQILQGLTVLLVEDSPDNCEIFTYFLDRAGAKVDVARDGRQGIEAARRSPDLILIDIQLPYIDGKQATRAIRSEGYRQPIVALTAHTFPEERRACLAAGCNGLIGKPIRGDDFVAQVAQFVERRDA